MRRTHASRATGSFSQLVFPCWQKILISRRHVHAAMHVRRRRWCRRHRRRRLLNEDRPRSVHPLPRKRQTLFLVDGNSQWGRSCRTLNVHSIGEHVVDDARAASSFMHALVTRRPPHPAQRSVRDVRRAHHRVRNFYVRIAPKKGPA